ncbi:MAG: UDPGP type 1 family protein [Lentisphaerae bacterium]|nr:UDPGP type 1 family protein [Lentisphaerota bacterium]
MTYDEALARLKAHGQEGALRFWNKLDAEGRRRLLAQIGRIDLDNVSRLARLLTPRGSAGPAHADIAPATVLPGLELADAANVRAGRDALRAGRVGVLLVAGGQGSRLGFEGPKGMFPLAPITGATLFEIHARKILALQRAYGADLPLYVMTSRANDAATRDFFERHGRFGLPAGAVRFFVQGMWPALTADGQLLLDAPDHVFESPDGHGGILDALEADGSFDDMSRRGVEFLFYFQVDNPLVEIADPGFIGLHRRREADASVKVCAKKHPAEGLGVAVERGGRNAIVEYSELTDAQKEATGSGGRLLFLYGSVAIHVFSLDFLRQECARRLPVHIAHKKVPYCDAGGQTVAPDRPNAFKFEKFIFDVLPDAERVVNVEFAREEEFSPVKNARGDDSPDTARRDMMRKQARRLEQCGVTVPRDAQGLPRHRIEIDPCFAPGPADLRGKVKPGMRVEGDLLLA